MPSFQNKVLRNEKIFTVQKLLIVAFMEGFHSVSLEKNYFDYREK